MALRFRTLPPPPGEILIAVIPCHGNAWVLRLLPFAKSDQVRDFSDLQAAVGISVHPFSSDGTRRRTFFKNSHGPTKQLDKTMLVQDRCGRFLLWRKLPCRLLRCCREVTLRNKRRCDNGGYDADENRVDGHFGSKHLFTLSLSLGVIGLGNVGP